MDVVIGTVRKLKNVKLVGIYKISGEMIKNGGEIVNDWIWKCCNKICVGHSLGKHVSTIVLG